jgi:serine/threonine protein kinase
MALAPATRLGPYEILCSLGAGGMGEVYEARDSRLDRHVALKVLKSDVASEPSRLARFEREAKAVASLNHPNILTVYDVGTYDGTPYVVTELLEGESLREVLSRRVPTQRQVLGWAVHISQGLAAAHQKGFVHRDLKPENLFLTADGRIKILDFGLAKQTGPAAYDSNELTASAPSEPGAILGTIGYMSPEQAQGGRVDARSDLFSFGVVLYELLAKRHPYRDARAARERGPVDPEGDGQDRPEVSGERPGGALSGRARPRAGLGGGSGGAGGCAPGGGGGEEPLSGNGLVHGEGGLGLLRAGRRSQGSLGEAAGKAASGRHWSVRGWQDVVRPRWRGGRKA